MKINSKILNLIIIFAAIVLLIVYVVYVDGIENILKVFACCDVKWLFVGIVAMFGYWLFEIECLNLGLEILNKKLNFKNGLKNCIIGQFFSNITPSATGGQPFQIIFLKNCGISIEIAISALIIKFICFQLSLAIFCTVVLFFKINEYLALNKGFVGLMFIGYAVNVVIAIILILIGFKEKFLLNLTRKMIKILGVFKMIKNPESKIISAGEKINSFCVCFKLMYKEKMKLFKMILFSFMQSLIFYLINVIVVVALRGKINLIETLSVIAGAACVQMSSTFVPLPGAVGCAEFAYLIVFGKFFKTTQLNVAVLLWRFLTFYLPTILGLYVSRNIFDAQIKKEQTSVS